MNRWSPLSADGNPSMSQLLRRRRAKLEEDTANTNEMRTTATTHVAFHELGAARTVDRGEPQPPLNDDQTTQDIKLSTFLQVHKGIRPLQKDLPPVQSEARTEARTEAKPLESDDEAVMKDEPPAVTKPQMPTPRWLSPLPPPVPLRRPATVEVSSEMLVNVQLTRQVQANLPDIHFIERGPVNQGQVAEVTVAPDLGIMLTSLQKIKQRPLPAQKDFFGVRDRLRLLARRYKGLFVLVSEGGAGGQSYRLDGPDSQALDDLTAFAGSLKTSIEVRYVAGNHVELARWISTLVSHFVTASVDEAAVAEGRTSDSH